MLIPVVGAREDRPAFVPDDLLRVKEAEVFILTPEYQLMISVVNRQIGQAVRVAFLSIVSILRALIRKSGVSGFGSKMSGCRVF